MAAGLVGLGVLLSAVQWIPSKELLDRSPRAGGLSHEELTYGSWHPELLPTLVVREAYGTRARDTDWMHGFYPYHEMNAYLGLLGLALAVIGAGGPGLSDRWTNFWVLLAALGGILMLGKFTFLFDHAHKIPILGSSREPVRFHLWVSLAVAALAAVGVDRLGRPGQVRLRYALAFVATLIAVSIPIMLYIYSPVWTQPRRWTHPYHLARYRWLGHELTFATARTAILVVLGFGAMWWASRTTDACRKRRLASLLPLLVLVDLAAAHWRDAPTVSPAYWTSPPETVRVLRADPDLIRVFGIADKHSGEPGYASERIDFLPARDPLDWSLPAAWGLSSSAGKTPMISRRLLDYFDHVRNGRLDIESVSHVVTGRNMKHRFPPNFPVGAGFIHRNTRVLPRARLMGRPVYAEGPAAAVAALEGLGPETKDRLVVEDPSRPIPETAVVSGSAKIVTDLPERVVVETESTTPAYLLLTDTFDPGWSATLDGQSVPIRPAYVAFRAVALPAGKHTVVFTYVPAGFMLGLSISAAGVVLALLLLFLPAWPTSVDHEGVLRHPVRFRKVLFLTLALIIALSAIPISPDGRIAIPSRWKGSVHQHTWGARDRGDEGEPRVILRPARTCRDEAAPPRIVGLVSQVSMPCY